MKNLLALSGIKMGTTTFNGVDVNKPTPNATQHNASDAKKNKVYNT